MTTLQNAEVSCVDQVAQLVLRPSFLNSRVFVCGFVVGDVYKIYFRKLCVFVCVGEMES